MSSIAPSKTHCPKKKTGKDFGGVGAARARAVTPSFFWILPQPVELIFLVLSNEYRLIVLLSVVGFGRVRQ
jgi:hypothetical protein